MGLLASMVPSAERAEAALTCPATRLVGNGVILIALRCWTLATGSGTAGRAGLDQVPQQPARLVAGLFVAVITCACGQRADSDPESLEERSGQRVQRVKRLSWNGPPVCRPIPDWPILARTIPRRSPRCRIPPPRAVRRWMMRSRALLRWASCGSALGPPALGPPALGPPALGPPALGPPALGPPALGPPALGPPALGPPALGPPALGVLVQRRGAAVQWMGAPVRHACRARIRAR